MALIATVGDPSANSYVTVSEANSYFATRLHSEAWENESSQASALITATSQLDWYIQFKGTQTTSTQALKWPRADVTRPDGTEVSDSIIPNDVKVAVYELALSSLVGDRTADNPLAGIEQVKAGSLMIKADNGDAHSTKKDAIPEKVKRILSDLISINNIGIRRLIRA